MDYNINITEAAVVAFKEKLNERKTPNARIRLGVRGGGCVGYTYAIQFEDNEPKEKDIEYIFNDLKIVVDKKSIIFMNGCTLNWEKTLLNSGFIFSNPLEKKKCGCGSSFSF